MVSHKRITPVRAWAPLSDAEWLALLPFVLPRAPQGRRVADLRARMDAIFRLATTAGEPWHALPAGHGNPATVARFFRRLSHAGLWHRLLAELVDADPRHPLRAIEHFICRATRRAARIGGMALILLIRRLGLRSALHGPPHLLPDPVLSETLRRVRLPERPVQAPLRPLLAFLRLLRRLHRQAAGRARIPRALRWSWP